MLREFRKILLDEIVTISSEQELVDTFENLTQITLSIFSAA